MRLDRLAVIIDCDDDGGRQVDLGEDWLRKAQTRDMRR